MTKPRISATVDEDIKRYLDQPHINASAFVNRLLTEAINGNGTNRSMLELRESQLQSQRKSLQSQLETVESDLAFIREQLQSVDTEAQAETNKEIEQTIRQIEVTKLSSTGVTVITKDKVIEELTADLPIDVEEAKRLAVERYEQ